MRPLSRLLSVLLALILICLSLNVVSAHGEGIDHTFNEGDDIATIPTYGARLTISLVDSAKQVHVGDTLKFLVTVERGNHDLPLTDTVVRSVFFTGESISRVYSSPERSLSKALTTTNPIEIFAELEYTVQPEELGDAEQRLVPIQFDLIFAPDQRRQDRRPDGTFYDDPPGEHSVALVRSNKIQVLVTKQPGAAAGASGVTIDFDIERPEEMAVGQEVMFNVTVTTTDYGLAAQTVTVRKQLYGADDETDGGNVAIGVTRTDQLGTNAVGAVKTVKYKLRQEDLDASKVEFSYKITITDVRGVDDTNTNGTSGDLYKADGTTRVDLHGDYKEDFTETHELAAPVVEDPEPEATAEPNISKTDAATVMRGEGNVVHIDPAAGPEFSLSLGVLGTDGTLIPNGYIRDNDLGQTYAVVTRESDGEIVRVWISSHSPFVGDIDWDSVLTFYNHPVDVVNAIALDHTTPSENQLVDTGVKWYVYLAGKWRHIPDIPTFQSRSYFYCDLTTASADWVDNVDLGQALPMSYNSERMDYPSCR